MKKDKVGKVLIIFGLLLVAVGIANCRERIHIPLYVDDTLRIEWRNVKPSYYNIYQVNYAGQDKLIKLVGHDKTSSVININVPTYNYRAAFSVKAVFIEQGKSYEVTISDTFATFFSKVRHLFCDVNLDGKVDSTDIFLINGDGYGVPIGNLDYKEQHDVNGDGDINLVDIGFVYKRMKGIEQSNFYSTKNNLWDYETMEYPQSHQIKED